ncbi:hypothetical protein GCK32_022316, partial [Trichostrongylus colubriformis]
IDAPENNAVEEQIYKIVQSASDGMDTDTITTLTATVSALDRQVVMSSAKGMQLTIFWSLKNSSSLKPQVGLCV